MKYAHFLKIVENRARRLWIYSSNETLNSNEWSIPTQLPIWCQKSPVAYLTHSRFVYIYLTVLFRPTTYKISLATLGPSNLEIKNINQQWKFEVEISVLYFLQSIEWFTNPFLNRLRNRGIDGWGYLANQRARFDRRIEWLLHVTVA